MIKILKLFPVMLLLAACSSETNTNATNNESTSIDTAETIEAINSEVTISNAWVREPAPGQEIGAAYMTLNSPQASKLVYAEAKGIAATVEMHSMSMDNGVMKMRMLDALTLEANTPKSLEPGGFHLMLFGLEKPLVAGEEVTFRLCFEDNAGNITHQNVTVPIKSQ